MVEGAEPGVVEGAEPGVVEGAEPGVLEGAVGEPCTGDDGADIIRNAGDNRGGSRGRVRPDCPLFL